MNAGTDLEDFRMTLQESWDGCIKMWEWIVENLDINAPKEDQVHELKIKYVAKNDLTMSNNCFFCEYSTESGLVCSKCPGRLVDPTFLCDTSAYNYGMKPIRFLAKIKELNERRMS